MTKLGIIATVTGLALTAALATPVTAQAVRPELRPEGAMDCAIMPSRVIEVATPLDGVLEEVLVRPGQAVEKGELIARLDTAIAAAELAHAELKARSAAGVRAARGRIEAAQVQYDSARPALQHNVLSRVEYEKIKAELVLAERELEREMEAMALAAAEAARIAVIVAKGEIRAPASGIIGEQLLDAGEAAQGRPLAQVIVVEPMRVEVFVPLGQLQALREGAPHVVLAGTAEPILLEPELDYISPLADQSSRTIRAYYTLHSDRVVPGYRCYLLPPEAAAAARSGL